MNLRKTILLSLIVCGGSLCLAAAAFAAEEGGASSASRLAEVFKWINTAIVVGLVLWVFTRLLPPVFRRNAERIGAAIGKATAAKAEADRRMKDAEQRLARLDEEVRVLREQAERDGMAEAERIRALAKSDAEKVGQAGKAEIAAAERAARVELKALAARLAVSRAESLVVKQLTPQAQEALVAGFLKSLLGSPN
jgi:F0F1-type ATP synthase membrane subunit b/b'